MLTTDTLEMQLYCLRGACCGAVATNLFASVIQNHLTYRPLPSCYWYKGQKASLAPSASTEHLSVGMIILSGPPMRETAGRPQNKGAGDPWPDASPPLISTRAAQWQTIAGQSAQHSCALCCLLCKHNRPRPTAIAAGSDAPQHLTTTTPTHRPQDC
jgi:hypothetical protein